ncbi:hypothetical protein SPI_06027 [Niveomyces insectorum RCEF 264]|uniref:Extracellular membrane protein CFEM domain-containing protein n=1 Tax=Niveomyces insectorum RCEF 264 TaxID=1081102 RepID=A0A167SQB1_9HYPO|nr:hypothetical protein SPI_06027 [Niveomyces insectorum RCEF 264]
MGVRSLRQTLRLFALAAVGVLPVAVASSSSEIAFGGCLGTCVANNGCKPTNSKCVCAAAQSTPFLDMVVICLARSCLLTGYGGGDGNDDDNETVKEAVAAINQGFLQIVESVCAHEGAPVPPSKVSAAVATASSAVVSLLGGGGDGDGGGDHTTFTRTSFTQHQTRTTTMTVPGGGGPVGVFPPTATAAPPITATIGGGEEPSFVPSAPPAPPATTDDTPTGAPTEAPTNTPADTENTAAATTTTKSATRSATKPPPAVDTTEGTPFTNANAAPGQVAPSWWWPAAVAAAATAMLTVATGGHLRLV